MPEHLAGAFGSTSAARSISPSPCAWTPRSSNEAPLDYYIFPSIDVQGARVRLAEENEIALRYLPLHVARLPVRHG